jgi:hypothetical protein
VVLAGATFAIAGFAAGLTTAGLATGVLTGADLGATAFVLGAVLLAGVIFSTGALSAAACTGLIFDIRTPSQINDINSLYRLFCIANEFFMTKISGGL